VRAAALQVEALQQQAANRRQQELALAAYQARQAQLAEELVQLHEQADATAAHVAALQQVVGDAARGSTSEGSAAGQYLQQSKAGAAAAQQRLAGLQAELEVAAAEAASCQQQVVEAGQAAARCVNLATACLAPR
jgi:hypothetical protein